MKKQLIQYIVEAASGKGLTIFDIDDTMFTSKARVRVKNNNTNQVKELSPKEYNNYKLRSGEEWDYGEFKSSNSGYFFSNFINSFKRLSNSLSDITLLSLI